MHPTLKDLGIDERSQRSWREQVERDGGIGLARRLLAAQRELRQLGIQIRQAEHQVALLTHEAYLLVGYEQAQEGGFNLKEEE